MVGNAARKHQYETKLQLRIYVEETRDAILKMENGKSPGSDGVSVELLIGSGNIVK